MDTKTVYRQLFADMVGRLGEDLDLAQGALYIAAEDSPDVDIEGSNSILDQMAQEVSENLEPSMDLPAKLRRLSLYLGVTQGFCGDEEDYYNPRNVYLNQVLKRKRGIPITLSLVYMEVGSRLGIFFEPIGLPGHLVMRAGSPDTEIYVDPFHYGRLLSREDCAHLIRNMFGGKVELTDHHFRPYTKRQFLIRLLANLKNVYTKRGDYHRAIAAADRVALVDPHMSSNLKERAWMFSRTNQYGRAIEDLESYLKLQPEAEDAKRVRGQIRALWKTIATLN